MNPDPADTESNEPKFVFVVCNPRSQLVCKNEIAASQPDWLPSFSRPGFLTYKLPADCPDRFSLPLTFARAWGRSTSQIRSDNAESIAEAVRQLQEQVGAADVHCWDREWTDRNPASTDDAADPTESICAHLATSCNMKVNQLLDPDARVVDLIRVDPGQWWLGWHVAGSIHQRWPGGIPVIDRPKTMISRAYLKMTEAIRWSGIPIKTGDVCAEIGSAPGGSCQRLLELGARVIAVDPADLHESIAKNKRVTHLKMRGRDVPHRQLAQVSWLFADSNVAPNHTLDTVEALTQGQKTRFRGLILTLKFGDLKLASELPAYVERVRSWGYRYVKTRQLAFGRQEVCLVALKQRSVRRFRSTD